MIFDKIIKQLDLISW